MFRFVQCVGGWICGRCWWLDLWKVSFVRFIEGVAGCMCGRCMEIQGVVDRVWVVVVIVGGVWSMIE